MSAATTRPIAGAGFALMAWREAQRRKYESGYKWPQHRSSEWAKNERHPSAEFYRITDRASMAWYGREVNLNTVRL